MSMVYHCLVPVRLSPRPSRSIRFGDVSEANGRGKPRQKQTAHAFVLFFKMADFRGLYKMLQTAANYGFKTLVDACVIVDRLLPSLETPENVMHGPLTIDFSSCNLIPTEHYAEFVALKTFGDGNCCFRAASKMLFRAEQNHLEIRVCTILELAKYSFSFYLAEGEVITTMEAEMAILNAKAVPG